MATCRDCFHSYICFNSNGETRYYGPDLAVNNVEQLCRKYKRKPALPLTCKDCLHNDACTDMLEALGFKVDGDGFCDCVNGVNGPIEDNYFCSYGERKDHG